MAVLGDELIDCGLVDVCEAYLENALDAADGLAANNRIMLLIFDDSPEGADHGQSTFSWPGRGSEISLC